MHIRNPRIRHDRASENERHRGMTVRKRRNADPIDASAESDVQGDCDGRIGFQYRRIAERVPLEY